MRMRERCGLPLPALPRVSTLFTSFVYEAPAFSAFGVSVLGVHYLIAKCGSAGCTFFWNFLARRQLLFVKHRGD